MPKDEAAAALGANGKLLFKPDTQINRHFMLKRLISSGGFGQVYSGVNINTGHLVAIKAESIDAKIPLLRIEASCLEALNIAIRRNRRFFKGPIPNYYGYGETHAVRYMVMDLFGKNIRELKKGTKNDCFSITTSLWIMKKMITALKYLHRLGWIHRDVKPANFCVGLQLQGKQELFLVDFGMARHFISRNGVMKMRRESSSFHGTVRYASLTTHRHQDMSRYDDLWSVYYITVENMTGQLPWRFVNEKTEVEKMKETIDLLMQQFGTEPNPPASLLVLYRNLCHASFYHEPKYDYIVTEISLDLARRNFFAGSLLDWQIPEKLSEHNEYENMEEVHQEELASCERKKVKGSSRNNVKYECTKELENDHSYYFIQQCEHF
ncbi:unnamed protein product [Thelazia callipaeda]|uniref:Protein kinase domain-containing protein n=1 Tax=Thelazia callipaeda TaxID=103827 RepID=A0A0N5CZ98_THECL|nr:unnamed protein product [Thelazia callipaeda]